MEGVEVYGEHIEEMMEEMVQQEETSLKVLLIYLPAF